MGSDLFKKLTDKYPFITLCSYANVEYIGIIQNHDVLVTTIYDFGSLHTADQKKRFLELGETWWWESNRSIPINIFLRNDWETFKFSLRTFVNKDLTILHGPVCSLNDITKRKSKRKSITLVRRVN
jgi:hypothetical protein